MRVLPGCLPGWPGWVAARRLGGGPGMSHQSPEAKPVSPPAAAAAAAVAHSKSGGWTCDASAVCSRAGPRLALGRRSASPASHHGLDGALDSTRAQHLPPPSTRPDSIGQRMTTVSRVKGPIGDHENPRIVPGANNSTKGTVYYYYSTV
ncbi:hypothetical protein BO94DRAFT_533121 [Aspergillus sclerotioniger CBS 115572]|uniref:Uncharacterized protein n=1 Tax=Aspergillus sclerotioniger CBS 115572 TaxID=1450535 RepID=A0A317X526_9EURO|nr:hypothetical protein BO94DRAFT_533121 [Aspergillus sclerotioniger CBS 115572]PWY91660.1 hypothetical protein BO94DRAFT_533121 [Aspergillus sclerotioniger CBS 115572]